MSHKLNRKETRALLTGMDRKDQRATYEWKEFLTRLKEKGNEQ